MNELTVFDPEGSSEESIGRRFRENSEKDTSDGDNNSVFKNVYLFLLLVARLHRISIM
jgi:hypothetical protein